MPLQILELSINLNHQEHSTAPIVEVANFKVTNLELDLIQQTYNTKVEVRLASIDLKQFRPESTTPLISTPFSSGIDQYLFVVRFTQVSSRVSCRIRQVTFSSPGGQEFSRVPLGVSLVRIKSVPRVFVFERPPAPGSPARAYEVRNGRTERFKRHNKQSTGSGYRTATINQGDVLTSAVRIRNRLKG